MHNTITINNVELKITEDAVEEINKLTPPQKKLIQAFVDKGFIFEYEASQIFTIEDLKKITNKLLEDPKISELDFYACYLISGVKIGEVISKLQLTTLRQIEEAIEIQNKDWGALWEILVEKWYIEYAKLIELLQASRLIKFWEYLVFKWLISEEERVKFLATKKSDQKLIERIMSQPKFMLRKDEIYEAAIEFYKSKK